MLKAQIAKGPFEPTSWYTTNPWWHQRWLDVIEEVIDLYQPDLLYSDGGLPQRMGNTLYAFQMRWPEDHRTVIRTLTPADQVKSVRLLGTGEVPFEQSYGALIVSLPDRRPTPYVNCLAIELNS